MADRTGSLRQGRWATLNNFAVRKLLGAGKWLSSTLYAGARALGGMRRRERLTTLRGLHGTPIDAVA